jgi:multiple sugar transport system substrate-binding protein
MAGSTIDQQTYQERADLYTKAHPNVTVTVKNLPVANSNQELSTMIAGNDAPDIIEVGAVDSIGESLFAKGQLLNLSPYIKSAGMNLQNTFNPGLISGYAYQGQQYAIPDRGGYIIFYYNKTMFEKAGLPLPTDGWTWNQFVNDAKKLTIVKGGKTVQWGTAVDNWEPAVDSVTHSFGATLANSTLTTATLDSPQYESALETYNDLVWKWHVSPSPQDFANYGSNVNRDALFAEGKTAMIWAGPWDIPTDAQDHINFGITDPPEGNPGEPNMMAAGTGLAVSSQSRYPQIAFDVIQTMTSTAGEMKIVQNHEDIPAAVADIPAWAKTLPAGVSYNQLAAASNMIFTPQFPVQQVQMLTVIQQDLVPFFDGDESVSQAAEKATTDADQVLSASAGS